MKFFLGHFFFMNLIMVTHAMPSSGILMQPKVVYGEDSRKEVFEVSSKLQIQAQATAGMVFKNDLRKLINNNFMINNTQTLQQSDNVCTSEKFYDQPTVAVCSGFLVAPDVLVTAGHCVDPMTMPNACANFTWVFGLEMENEASINTKNISGNQVYNCKQIIAQHLDNEIDYAVIKLDRKVVGRNALKINSKDVLLKQALTIIGHPSGLPTKVSVGNVISNRNPSYFSTNLDSFHGNSGSAVLDSKTGEVVGILVRGKTDYIPSEPRDPNSCMIVNRCNPNGTKCLFNTPNDPDGEQVTKISLIAKFVKLAR